MIFNPSPYDGFLDIEYLPEVYHVKLIGVPREFLYKPAELFLKTFNAFLEVIKD